MEVESVITLEDDTIFELLDKTIYDNTTYFLAELLNQAEEGQGKYVIFKQIQENDDIYVEKEEKEEILFEVLKKLSSKFTNDLENLTPEDLL